jgi:hypothetical protein
VWLIVEIEEEANPGIFLRTGQYELLLMKEVNPLCEPAGALVVSLVLNLSGKQKRPGAEWAFGSYGTRLQPLVVDVARQDAGATLERLERGELGLTVLPLLALLKGGGERAFIERWKRVVEGEPEEARRLSWRDWAPIMAELTRKQMNWTRAMEGWMARESKIITGWLKQGREQGNLDTMREVIRRNLELRLKVAVPEPIQLAIEGTSDMAKLDEWYVASLNATDLADFHKRMRLES